MTTENKKKLAQLKKHLNSNTKRDVVFNCKTTDATVSRYLNGLGQTDDVAEAIYNAGQVAIKEELMKNAKFLGLKVISL